VPTYTATVTETMNVYIKADSVEDAEQAIAMANYAVSDTDVTHTELNEVK